MNVPAPISYKIRTFRAIFLVVAGYFCYNIADLCSKLLQNHYTLYQVLGTSSLLGLIITATWLFVAHGRSAFIPPNFKLHLLRSLTVMLTGYFMVSSLKTLPLADFYGIIFIMPFIVMVMAVLFLKEHVGWRRWSAAAVAFVGILIIAGPQFNNMGVGIVQAFLGAVCASVNIILLRRIKHGGPIAIYAFYPFIFIFAMSMTGLFLEGGPRPVQTSDIPLFLLHGPVVVVAITCVSIGFSKAPEAGVVAPFLYTQILWGVLFGWIFFEALPTATTWMGLTLVAAAGLYSLWREYKISHHL
jgi:S-adenosylmethionine uptake transporter